MHITSIINRICAETKSFVSPEEREEILFLLENDVSLFHLSKINLEEAVQEALLYISPDY